MNPTLPRSANRHTRRWLPYAGAVVLVGLITAGLWPRPLPVETARVTVGTLRATVTEEGKPRIKQRYVVSAPVTGQLQRIPFKAGAEVRAGETVVAVIEPVSPTLLDARTRVATEAKRDTAVANLEKAFQEAKPNDKAGTLARLNEQQKILGQLWKQTSEEKLKNGMNLPPPSQSFGLADPAKAQQLRNDLQKGDVSSANKELEQLKQKAEELAKTQDPVEREKLKQELMDRLQNLKDTLDQQMNSQALDSDLQRAMEQLALSNVPELSGESAQSRGVLPNR